MEIHTDPIRSKRVPRFVEEYAKDRNGTQAAIRAGYTANADAACTTAVRLLGDPRVQALIQEEMERVSKEATVDAAFVLREYLALVSADPSRIVHVRRVNCRFCNGIGHKYQWNAREYAEACDNEERAARREKREPQLVDCSGGFGWKRIGEPHPECPECHGEGVEDLFFRDTEALTGPERKLIAGIKRTKDGLEIKMRDQDGALKILAQYVGMLVERRETKLTNGAEEVTAALRAVADKLPV